MEHISAGWNDISRNLLGWILLLLVYTVVVLLTCGLGLLLSPNLLRAAKHAVERGGPPDLMDLFDLSDLGGLVMLALVSLVVSFVGQVIPVVGPLLLGVFLMWTAPLVIDGHYGVPEAVNVSFRAVSKRFAEPAIFSLILVVMLVVSAWFCGVPLLITIPLALVSTWRFYTHELPWLLEVGDRAGVRRAAA